MKTLKIELIHLYPLRAPNVMMGSAFSGLYLPQPGLFFLRLTYSSIKQFFFSLFKEYMMGFGCKLDTFVFVSYA